MRREEDEEAEEEIKRASTDVARDQARASEIKSKSENDCTGPHDATIGGVEMNPEPVVDGDSYRTQPDDQDAIGVDEASGSGLLLPGPSRPFATLGAWYRLIAAEDPAYFRRIMAFADLDAWRPPTPAEASRMPTVPLFLSRGARKRAERVAREADALRGEWVSHTPRWRAVAGGLPPRFWSNPLAVPLPFAPSMSVLCTHGVSRPAERGYHYVSVRANPAGTGWESLGDLARRRREKTMDREAERAAGAGEGSRLEAPQLENNSQGTQI